MNTATKDRAKMSLRENVTYQLRDKDGNLKSLFAVNKLGKAILEIARKGYSLYNEDGSPKTGLRARLAFNGLQIPGLTGNFTKSLTVSNLITNTGMAGVASRINGDGAEALFNYIAIGIGAVAADVTDTTLGSEITTNGGERGVATLSRTTTDVTNDTATFVLTYNFTGAFAVTESGVLNAVSSGVLLCRQVFTAINVASADSLQVTWDIDVD